VTNLQEVANPQQLRWRQRLLLGLPIAAGGLVAAAFTALFTVPQWMALQSSAARLQQLEGLRQQVPLLRDQLVRSGQEIERAEAKQRTLLTLIEGSGEFATFLAQLDLEASRHGVQLELFEPAEPLEPAAEGSAPAPPANPDSGASPAGAPQDPLLGAGLQAERVLLSARGSYPSLLAFMRSVERLSLLVVPSDFALELVEGVATDAGAAADGPRPRVPELKLSLTYYKAPEGPLRPPAPAAPAALDQNAPPAADQATPPAADPNL
jgi:type IV pilus assembly protein PilO